MWKNIIGAGIFAAVVLYLTLSDQEQIQSQQVVNDAKQELGEQVFDDEFSDAWNGEPGSKIKKQRAENVAGLKTKIAKAESKRDGLDDFDTEFVTEGQQAIRDEDSRLSSKPKPASGIPAAGGTQQ